MKVDATRLRRTQRVLQERELDALFVGPGADLRYLVGYHAMPMERLTLLVVPAEGEPVLVVPELEAARARASGAVDLVPLRTWQETDDPLDPVVAALECTGSPTAGGSYAVQDALWSAFTLRLQARLGDGTWTAGSRVMRELRVAKDAAELEALRRVGHAIDAVHEQVPDLLRTGRTETAVGRDIADLIQREHDEVAFVIVASGPNAASPHHETGDRPLAAGDTVVVDIGGALDGYYSDCTRTYVLGEPPDGFRELYTVLLDAQRAAVEAVRPGVAAESIDRAARSRIVDAGYGDYFTHRTGHGIGIEVHEEPYVIEGNDEALVAGMTFSVEPGIYVPERHGARIEDIVAVTDDGVERLNRTSRELIEVPA